jgi:hypothetical protein
MLRFVLLTFALMEFFFRIPEAAGDESSQNSEAGVRSQRHCVLCPGQVYSYILHALKKQSKLQVHFEV